MAIPAVVPAAAAAVTTVTGTGFAPGRQVVLSFTTSLETASATADAHGAFTTALVIFPKSAIGGRTVRAAVVGAKPVIAADAPLLVQHASLQPPFFGNRR